MFLPCHVLQLPAQLLYEEDLTPRDILVYAAVKCECEREQSDTVTVDLNTLGYHDVPALQGLSGILSSLERLAIFDYIAIGPLASEMRVTLMNEREALSAVS